MYTEYDMEEQKVLIHLAVTKPICLESVEYPFIDHESNNCIFAK